MKFIIIFLLSFALIQPAYAAREVKGSVPVVQPLQPPAIGISADVSHNIQLQSPTQGQGSGSVAPTGAATSAQNQTVSNQAPQAYKKSSDWLWWLLIILGIVILGLWVKRKGPQV